MTDKKNTNPETRREPVLPGSPEDQALWQLMGILEDEAPSADFVDRVCRQVQKKVVHRPWYRRSWVAAAAVIMLVVTIWPLLGGPGGDRSGPLPDNGNSAREYQGVVELLDGLSDVDVLVLEAAEEESIQTDWFGG